MSSITNCNINCYLLVQLTLESSHCRRTVDITVRGQDLFNYVVFEELQRPSRGRIISVHNCGGQKEIFKSQVPLKQKHKLCEYRIALNNLFANQNVVNYKIRFMFIIAFIINVRQ